MSALPSEHVNHLGGQVTGYVVQARDIGQVTITSDVPVRSRYREHQVKRIAPQELRDREAELGELAQFCTVPEVPSPYLWLCAGAWAGKSALTSWFVLNPPPGVQVVSFFVMARWARHDTRAAFIEIVLIQLAELLGQPMPRISAVNREIELAGMLTEAAEACERRGERLVLVVDGLDEDRRVGGSIAELLPASPVAGMRIIVTGRPGPTLPMELGNDHALRDPASLHALAASPAAEVIRVALQRDLDALLEGHQCDRDVVGFVATARGGLSLDDLVELTRWNTQQLHKALNGRAGRSFIRRAADWRPETAPEVFLLAHQSLQAAAEDALEDGGLRKYRQRIHNWAEQYRQAGWPPDTPQYLLNGYFNLLDSATKVAYAADPARHDRLLAVSGGDAPALAEIVAAQEALSAADEPNAVTAMRLAMHRQILSDRNARTPVRLPAVLARLGMIDRAEALARAIPGRWDRIKAMDALMRALVGIGDTARALKVAQSIDDPAERDSAIGGLAWAVTESGDLDRVESLVDAITDPAHRARVLSTIVITPADLPRARAFASTVTSLDALDTVRYKLVNAIGKGGDIAEAIELVETINDGLLQSCAISDLVQILAARGDIDHALVALRMLNHHPLLRGRSIARLIVAATVGGDLNQAQVFAQTLPEDEDQQDAAMAGFAEAYGAMGDVERALSLLDKIKNTAHKASAICALIEIVDVDLATSLPLLIPDSADRRLATSALIEMMCRRGELRRAEEWIAEHGETADRLLMVAEAAITVGDRLHGNELAARAQTLASTPTYSYDHHGVIAPFAKVVVATGDVDRAEHLAQLIITPPAGHERSFDIGGLEDHGEQIGLVRLLATAGDKDLAESLARRLNSRANQFEILTILIRRIWSDGEHDRASRLADFAQTLVRESSYDSLVPELVDLLTSIGKVDAARDVVRKAVSYQQEEALTALMKALGRSGDLANAEAALEETRYSHKLHALKVLAETLGPDRAIPLVNQLESRLETGAYSYDDLKALVALSEALGTEHVYRLIDKIKDQRHRVDAIVATAKNARQGVNHRLLIEAITLGHWPKLLEAVAKSNPEEVLKIFDEYTSRQKAQ